ncbi:SKI/DACH domain-containing protein 1-like isoform X2 [Rhodamnia argentea]|uniref:SKI/DACH domain-containing protein 1-like isoform X2 n=1 Tax=Rhodamnia argentea TaxID=178133 RepID=A0A8B8QKP7_9MYRT|nr:SKI/DACH domain-containing protein 1-like isoform X2 [Rhodamnia argentea]
MATTETSSRMTSSSPSRVHHHHHHHLLLCPRHHHLYHHHNLHRHHGNSCDFRCHWHPASFISPPPLPNVATRNDAEAAPCVASPAELNPLEADSSHQMLEQQDYQQQEEVFEDDEEEEPVFVLTDEWREFFARSEAKRKLGSVAKKKAKK